MKLIYLVSVVILSSCSSFSWREFFTGDNNSEKRNKTLMKDFEVDQNLQKKFEVKEVEPANPTPEPLVKQPVPSVDEKKETETTNIKTQEPVRTIERPKPVARKLVKQPEVKENQKVETKTKNKVKSPQEINYPDEFPQRLKDFDKDSAKYWGDFKPTLYTGEKTVLNITYMGINTGKITISTKSPSMIGKEPVYHLHARVKTSSYYSYLYEVDDYCDSLVRQSDFLPRKFSLIQRESGQNIDDLQLFDLESFKTISLYKRETKKKTKKKKKMKPVPRYFQDPLSIVYFIRGLPMEKEATYRIPVSNQGDVEEFTVKTGKKDTISTEIGEYEAYLLEIETKAKGKTIKGGQMKFWYSADSKKIFLKFEAEIKIGSIKGEIESYEP
ncbi:MAG: DUF3108 domain-containing protein [Bdellovibrionota bacterium]|nr:DUF3108 domain-containing protein [Bdellovibrionota bacterium]